MADRFSAPRSVSEALVAALDPLLGGEDASGEVAGALPDLPIVDIPAREPDRLFAVIWSGDGGWRDLDKTIGEILAQRVEWLGPGLLTPGMRAYFEVPPPQSAPCRF